LKPGDLCYLIDEMGRNQGICIFLNTHKPWTLSNAQDSVANPEFWHYEILYNETKKFVNSHHYTLLIIVNEEETL